jgi:RNA recognition motif-containing protein
MPAPSAAANKNTHGRPAFKNRGFAYVDFDSADMLFAALQLTEVPFNGSGRNVLVKNAKSFEGRPEAHASISAEGRNARGKMVDEKPPSKRIFVGNLGFDVTKETIEEHFAQCGAIEHVHMATFVDSGKCKGFAWITFSSIQAAEAAIRGYVLKEQEDADPHDEDGVQVVNEENGQATKSRKKLKPRKWFVNRLLGREIKREYAEDASVRYKKRFGGKKDGESNTSVGFEAPIAAEEDKPQSNNSAHDRRRQQRRAQKYGDEFRKVDARTIAPGAALSHAPRASAAIRTDGQKGRKAIFD